MKKIKQNFEESMLNGFIKSRALGSKIFKIPVASILPLCVLMSVTATNITYSQENPAATKPSVFEQAFPILALPADNVELVNSDGRIITVTVLSKTETGITIRNADGKETVVTTSQLNYSTIKKIWGYRSPQALAAATAMAATTPKDGPPERPIVNDLVARQKANLDYEIKLFKYWKEKTPANPTEARIKELYKQVAPLALKRSELLASFTTEKEINEQHNWRLEFVKSPATELLAKLRDPSDSIHAKLPIVARCTLSKISGLEKDPEWEKYNITQWDILSTLEIKPGPEKVSLRPKFKELGIHATEQIGPTSGLHSTYHLLQFSCKSAGINPPSLENIKAAGTFHPAGSFFPSSDYKALCGKRPVVTYMGASGSECPPSLTIELAKQELRNGRPLMATVNINDVVLTGFETNEKGHTSWEYLDSNRINENEGFHTLEYSPHLIGIGSKFSLKFE